jgi:pSer/pThr/pTyr-binding forkhead associated (FHA) protein
VTFDSTPSGQIFPVRVGRNRIGRDASNEISVPNDNAMSGTNTYVHYYEGSGSFVINDANSQNGTFVDGKNLEGDSVKANNYATIRAGITQFTLLIVNPMAAGESGR